MNSIIGRTVHDNDGTFLFQVVKDGESHDMGERYLKL